VWQQEERRARLGRRRQECRQGFGGGISGGLRRRAKRSAITPKSLSPVLIHELGSENVVPTAVVIELAAPIVDRERWERRVQRRT